ncbi:MAG: hypothetical protein A3H96_09475 [Acidobacteria bacterium RIFCSPLOWO2_02_FULL_67_36]|nr:MAG: hypothetical protein A3H96_09475 [Acidobacteria bacterium RIFCSPLOWO2_02_FULL_67_36]OFW24997.1 MAG: hypothetical protein A3G21_16265 [Acidobacteria bacterium RIFCSPLOWO2_12_FULL_66_21]
MSTIVFDGDETLWFSLHTYDGAMFEFLQYLHTVALPPHTPVNGDYTYHHYKKFESRNAEAVNPDTLEPWGIQRGRVAKSMVDTYHLVCWDIKRTRGIDVYDKEHERHIHDVIGDRPFDASRHPWAPGAEDMLDELSKSGHTLCVLTKYDQDTWAGGRAAALRVERFFKPENVLAIHGRKTADHFRQVSRAKRIKENGDFITVGNSKDDLIMVTEEDDKAWRGFFVAIPTTSPIESESGEVPRLSSPPIKHPRVVTVKKVTDILDYLRA